MKVAIVHDYLIDYGGAEKVLEALHEAFPKAPIYVSVLNKRGMGKMWSKFKDCKIIRSWFSYFPFSSKLISPLRFMIPAIWGSFDFSNYDVVITSASWAVTKGMLKGKKTIEICYLHTPPRYLYGYDTSRKWEGKWYAPFVNFYAMLINHFMRMYDFKQSQKVNYFIANSKNTGKRLEKFYRRSDYKVIYPPVDLPKNKPIFNGNVYKNYLLTGGRMVAAKNFDLIIKAAKKAKVPLKLFGTGIYQDELKRIASGENVEFLGKVTEEQKAELYKNAKAFIVAQTDEDFGITPLEANLYGCPVIAYKNGGYLESVIEGKTGTFFDELTVDSLVKAIKLIDSAKHQYRPEDCYNNAKRFSKERFIREIKNFVNSKVSS